MNPLSVLSVIYEVISVLSNFCLANQLMVGCFYKMGKDEAQINFCMHTRRSGRTGGSRQQCTASARNAAAEAPAGEVLQMQLRCAWHKQRPVKNSECMFRIY